MAYVRDYLFYRALGVEPTEAMQASFKMFCYDIFILGILLLVAPLITIVKGLININ